MLFEGKNQVVIYLEDWQMRMVKDFVHVDCHWWAIPIDSGPPVMKYMGPVAAGKPSAVKRMYFTD